MTIRRIELLCDDADFRDLQAEITRQQLRMRAGDGIARYPEWESNVPAACLAEAVRNLWEYRSMHDAKGK